MFTISRTNGQNPEFITLAKQLNAKLAEVNGEDHDFFMQYNQLDELKYVILVHKEAKAVGCGAIKAFDAKSMEIKRMFVLPGERRKGIAQLVLQGLETWAKELGMERCVLETSIDLIPAVKLYRGSGYATIPNYGQYVGIETSICMEKLL
ncbi:GNAT family N-acetyltransferase [Chitinophaga caeni]|uniref:GNAT family N-acetyltransferase n=1 Tax=Chitinophaga caeni TaxID=2029983 RepID=A0A291QV13_9BACT|nr:GNAT family N-acetyltransferase [Chitinophaga caeni]ATL47761.1 GNAT family N-acetyltransferase [Chitinophaga caeni]